MNFEVDDCFSGVISIKKDKKTILQNAYGYADIPNKIPNEIDTKFGTASAGKVFVATAILKLIESGYLQFNSSIGDILDFGLKQIDPEITVKQLLNHTSGIPDYFDESVMHEYSIDAKGTGAGGAFTAALDVEKFWCNLLAGKLINSELLNLMLMPQVKEKCYGYGIWLLKDHIPSFRGCDPGVNFISSYDLERKICLTILSNIDFDVERLHSKLYEQIRERNLTVFTLK